MLESGSVHKRILVRSKMSVRNAGIYSRLGLVLHGGGMRGAYGIGALSALEDSGLTESFDVVVGTSSGAVNGAYFLAGQCKASVRAYLDDLASRRFINSWRVSKILDIDFLIDEVVKKRRWLDVDKVRAAQSHFKIVATDIDTSEPIYIDGRDPSHDLYEALRATTAMPFAYNRFVWINDKRCIDGGVVEAVPIWHAIELGCTDILVILTSPLSRRRHGFGYITRQILQVFLSAFPQELRRKILFPDERFNEVMDIFCGLIPRPENINISVVHPKNSEDVAGRMTINREVLLNSIERGHSDMEAFLTGARVPRANGVTPDKRYGTLPVL